MDTTQFRNRLKAMHERLAEDTDERVERVPEKSRAPGQDVDVPTHAADRDVEGLDAEIAAGQSQQQMLEKIEHALERIDRGTFGECEACGKTVDARRLEEIPYTSKCIDCAREAQQSS